MDILELGLDVSQFNATKKKVLNEFIQLFDKLSKYDGMKINPSLGDGFSSFNASIKSAANSLEEIKTKVNEINQTLLKNSQELKNAANSTSFMTNAEMQLQKELIATKLELSEVTKALIKANKEKAESKKATEADTLAAKQNALEIQRVIKALIEQDREYKKHEKALEDKKKAEDKLAEATRKRIEAENKALEKAQKKQEEKDEAARIRAENQARKDREQQIKKEEAALKALEKEKIQDIKNTEKLTNDYLQLSLAIKDQQTRYANLYINKGKSAPETKQALRDLAATSAVMNDIDKQLNRAGAGSTAWARGLNDVWSNIRMIAYILPGLGIAGIFNLAYEAVSELVQGLTATNDSILKLTENQIGYNNTILQTVAYYKQLREGRENLQKYLTFGEESQEFKSQILNPFSDRRKVLEMEIDKEYNQAQRFYNQLKAIGVADTSFEGLVEPFTLKEKPKNASADYDFFYSFSQNIEQLSEAGVNATKKYDVFINAENKMKASLTKFRELVAQYNELHMYASQSDERSMKEKLDYWFKKNIKDNYEKTLGKRELNKQLEDLGLIKVPAGKRVFGEGQKMNQEELDKTVEKIQTEMSVTMQEYVTTKESAESLFNHLRGFSLKQSELARFTLQEDLDTKKQISDSEINLQITKNNALLARDTTFFEERRKLIIKNATENKKLIDNEVTKFILDPNNTDKQKAAKQEEAKNRKSEIDVKKKEELRQVAINEYNDYIDFISTQSKSIWQESATLNEGVFKNEAESYAKRINAYKNYIFALKQINEVEQFAKLERGKDGIKGVSPLTENQKNAIKADTQSQNSRLDYKMAEDVYNIVMSSGRLKIDQIEKDNQTQKKNNDEYYSGELKSLREYHEGSLRSYREFNASIQKIELDQKMSSIDLDVSTINQSIERYKDYHKQLSDEIAKNRVELSNIDKISNKQEYEAKNAEIEAKIRLQSNLDSSVSALRAKANSTELEKEKIKIKLLEDAYKEHDQNKIELGNKAFDLTKQIIDKEFDYRIQKLQRENQIRQEINQSQIDAVQKSSLSEKDKIANEIQLSRKKLEEDRKAKLEERKLKREQFLIDRAATLARIFYSTQEAVMNALAMKLILPGIAEKLATQRAALGALSAALVLAQPIPQFAEGVKNFKGGIAMYGEAGPEIVKEPNKKPYLVTRETVGYLPSGTDIVPIKDDINVITPKQSDDWDKFKWLASQIKKASKPNKTQVNNVINIELGFESYKRKIFN